MIGSLTQNHGQFYNGLYLGAKKRNAKDALFFEYEMVSTKEAQYNQLVQNLISSNKSVIIKTTWGHEWKGQSWVQLQGGEIYIINNLQTIEDEVNPQAASLIIDGLHSIYFLELIGAAEGV